MGFTEEWEAAEPEGLESEFQASEPERRRVRRTVLDPTHIVAGEDVPTGGGGRIEEVEREVIPGSEIADVPAPKEPPPEPEVMHEAYARRSMEPGVMAAGADALRAGTVRDREAAERTEQRIIDLIRAGQRDPAGTAAATIVGAGEGASLGFIPEITAAAETVGETPEALFDPFGIVSDAPERFGENLRDAREDLDSLRSVNPGAFDAGSAAGAVGTAVGGPSMVAPRGAPLVDRLGASMGTGALYGAAAGVGHADPESLDQAALPAMEGAALGGLGAGMVHGVAEVPAGIASWLQRGAGARQRAADEALLAATTSAGRGATAVDRFSRGETPRAIASSRARAAETLRSTGAIPRVGSIDRVAQGIDDATGRATQVMDDTRSAMDGEGPTYVQVAEALRARAASLEGVEAQPIREMLEARAEAYAAEGHVPMDYQRLMTEARNLRALGLGRTRQGTIPMGQQALGEVDQTLRGAYDDAVESQLGPAEREAYQRAREQYATLLTAGMNAGRGLAASAGNRLMGMSENQAAIAAAAAGGGPQEGLASTIAANTLRRYEPTLRATGAQTLVSVTEWLTRVLRESPEALGPYAGRFREALQRGLPQEAVATQHFLLSQSDPQYRAHIERARQEQQQ